MSDEDEVLGRTGRRLDRIRLVGVTATGYHGVFEHERREGQTFVADVTAHLDTRRAAATDDLAHTLDYGALAEQVAAVLAGEPADLVETVAERIAATVLGHHQVQAVDVAVHKPQAPITVPFADVVVEVRRDRSWLPAAEPLDAQSSVPWHPVTAPSAEPAAAPPAEDDPLPVPDLVAAGPQLPSAPLPAPTPPSGAAATAALPLAAAGALPGPGADAVPAGPGSDEPRPLDVPGEADRAGGPVRPAVATPAPPGGPDEPSGVPVAAVVPDGLGAGVGAWPADDDVVEAELVQDAMDVPPDEPVEVVLAIGSNVGPAQDTLRDAVADLAAVPGLEVVDVSALARTAPVGGPDQPDFLNAVVIARTTLSPRDLLRATAEVERVHGRERTVRWGPRTLDVDIVVYGQVSAVTDDLELPHPRAHERAFVLQPWAQVRPDAVLHGLGGGPVAALAATAPDRDGVRWLALDWLTAPVPAALPDPGAQPAAASPWPGTEPDPSDAPGPSGPSDPADPLGPVDRRDL
ncbi:2-amino-4-hydroxy-6-hydroxymethyldihydropteridine diphosphokinase [Cellulomonas sp. C5510]|uniref:2-amino-4-hydroxy-6- hydroxymethyldihydropteridine diphosphokinase n=1 Tax=Cellulomonas sp. C5510 TaxID=2871170 RepID=UPI001C9656B5|nr:2-amino-4-hydroxy-6-hydroxymethyldihydropteridine diphosphokinase [Cellulomonas sp. C5510]QZN86058.1 2-amino-4-hydroxy-6-hydroxymethyldihydropteridine diphosphokinase [Cellulomonas sp. C5510]